MQELDNDIRILKGEQGEILQRGKVTNKETNKPVRSDEDKAALKAVRGKLNNEKAKKRMLLDEAKETRRRKKLEHIARRKERKSFLTKIFKSKKK